MSSDNPRKYPSLITVALTVSALAAGYLALESKRGDPPTPALAPKVVPVPKFAASDADLDRTQQPQAVQGLGARALAAIDLHDRKAMAESRAAGEAAMAAGPVVNTASIGPQFPHRKGIEWTINAPLTIRRYNLALLPNLHEGPHECDGEWMAGVPLHFWTDAAFLGAQGAKDGTFPVRIQRVRGSSIDLIQLIQTVRVPIGPHPPFTQITLKSADWRMGDVVRIPLDSELLFVACDPYSGAVIEPRLSGVELGSGDATPIPGKVVRW